MANLGVIMMAGFIGGAVANSVIDTIHVKANCENANAMIKSSKKMQQYYEQISNTETKYMKQAEELTNELKQKHKEHQLVIDDYNKNNKERQRRTEIVLTTSLCVIIVNFLIKSNIFLKTINYLFPKK